jgi:SAM-dependent methyltransferase
VTTDCPLEGTTRLNVSLDDRSGPTRWRKARLAATLATVESKSDRFAAGDYSFWSRMFAPISRTLVEDARISAGSRVLDVASGDGNTALAAAERGAYVTALDLSRSQIVRGRSRALARARSIVWVEGRGERLPFADESFDVALDSFGDVLNGIWGDVAVAEMFRVVRPGGMVGIIDWTNEDFWGGLEELLVDIAPGTAGEPHLPPWGQEDQVRRALQPHAYDIRSRRHAIHPRFDSVDDFCNELLEKDAYVLDFKDKLSSEQWQGFCDELPRLVVAWNTSDDGSLGFELNYLQTVARKRDSGAPASVADRVQ